MRIAVAVLVAALLGSTPVSSSSTLRTRHGRDCSPVPAPTGAISLVGSRGAFGIVAFAPNACSQ